ncbi:MAG: TetR/AcrR family transcriptional regulator [Microthrixaceae bacterium]
MSEPARTSRPGGRTARTTEAVHSATLALLADRGFDSVSVDAVAETAGVHRTTVYRRWGNREALVTDALAANAADRVPIPDEGDLRSDLEALARVVADNLASTLGGSLATAMVGQPHSPEMAALSEGFWRARFDAAAVIVERAVARGECPVETEPKRLVEAAVAPIWFRLLVQRRDVDQRLIDDSVAAAMATT